MQDQLNHVFNAIWAAPESGPFQPPIKKKDIPIYFDVIKNPMDLQSIKKKIETKKYRSEAEFEYDIRLLVYNGCHYNGELLPLFLLLYNNS